MGHHCGYAARHAIIVCPQAEIGQGGECVDRMTGIIVALERAIPPAGGAGNQILNPRVPEHVSPSSLHFGVALRLLKQVDQGPVASPWFVCFEQP